MSLLASKTKIGAEKGEVMPKKRGKTLRRVVTLVLAGAVLCGTGFGVRALFFDGEERIALTGMTSYGALSTTMEGTGVTVPADSYSVTAASSEGRSPGSTSPPERR